MTTSSLPNWHLKPFYRLISVLGHGSFSNVYKAEDTRTGEMVAIKQVKSIFDDIVDAKRMLREISILRTMDHPNIVKIKDIIADAENPTFDSMIFVMEKGENDLKSLFSQPLYLDDNQIKYILYQIICGMRYMHSANILHRDLKPANILINTDCHIVICDFGLARSYERQNEQLKQELDVINEETSPSPLKEETKRTVARGSQHTMMRSLANQRKLAPQKKQTAAAQRVLTGHVVTRWYRAPEVILMERDYGPMVDVWSIGCIFAELLQMTQANAPTYADRGPLFPGKSCFPLSPDLSSKNLRAGYPSTSTDQLNMIIEVLGTPSENDTSFITDPKAISYLAAFGHMVGTNFQQLFPASDPEAIDLLRLLLNFNPFARITLDDALEHPYFRNIRNIANIEYTAQDPPVFAWDTKEVTIEEIRAHFMAEIANYN